MIKSCLVNKIVNTETNIKCSNQNTLNCYTEKGKIYTYLNPVSYLTALKEKELFASMDGIFADGGLLVKALRLVYGIRVTRRSFDMTSMAPELLSFANENSMSVCVIATKQDKLEKTISIFSNQYPNIIWKGSRNGYFSDIHEMEDEAMKIAANNPDFLIVGMGIKMQEEFLLLCKKAGFKGIGFTCGGFIHQTAEQDGKLDYYPIWVDKWNLRFFYRMYKEPYTRARYFKAAFVFPYRFLKERFS